MSSPRAATSEATRMHWGFDRNCCRAFKRCRCCRPACRGRTGSCSSFSRRHINSVGALCNQHKRYLSWGHSIAGLVLKTCLSRSIHGGLSSASKVETHLSTKCSAHKMQLHGLVDQRLCCQSKAVFLPVQGVVNFGAQDLLHEILQVRTEWKRSCR